MNRRLDPKGTGLSYLAFLLQWYNWPYLAGFAVGVLSLVRAPGLSVVGVAIGRRLGVCHVSGLAIVRVFGFALGVIGLTFSGALHDYWPAWQERAFLPVLVASGVLAALITRWIGRLFERHFPEIKAVGWGSPHLEGREARVVSRVVNPDYKAGRAQLMGEDDTLHVVMCKTQDGEIPYGATVLLGEYDATDGRYYVVETGARSATRDAGSDAEGE